MHLPAKKKRWSIRRREFTFRDVEGVSREYEFARLKVLNGISQGRICLVVCSIEALLQYTLPPKTLRENTLALHPGEEHSLQALSARPAARRL